MLMIVAGGQSIIIKFCINKLQQNKDNYVLISKAQDKRQTNKKAFLRYKLVYIDILTFLNLKTMMLCFLHEA